MRRLLRCCLHENLLPSGLINSADVRPMIPFLSERPTSRALTIPWDNHGSRPSLHLERWTLSWGQPRRLCSVPFWPRACPPGLGSSPLKRFVGSCFRFCPLSYNDSMLVLRERQPVRPAHPALVATRRRHHCGQLLPVLSLRSATHPKLVQSGSL